MRTEDDLREALASPADPERVDRLARTITAAIGAPARRRRPVLILAATVLILAVIAGFLLDNRTREAVPALTPTPTPVATAEVRVAGSWRMVYRVDPPPGWKVYERDVSPEVEGTELVGPRKAGTCSVDVWQTGTRPTSIGSGAPPQLEPLDDVTINGRPAYAKGPDSLQWFYQDDAVAEVTCGVGGHGQARTVAERVVFEPTSVRVPLRLRERPDGYELHRVTEEETDSGAPAAALSLMPTDADDAWEIEILVSKRESEFARTERISDSAERDTVAGFAALLDSRTGSLDLDVGSYLIQVHFAYGQDSDEWAPGRRQQLVRLAESMQIAPNLGDRGTWFDAEEAVPN